MSADILATIRQINPSAIRRAEEHRPQETFFMDSLLSSEEMALVPDHVQKMCAGGKTLARFSDVSNWTVSDYSPLHFSSKPLVLLPCNETETFTKPCLCSLPVCIVWYPCELRYCTNDGQTTDAGQPVPFRCGIKACRKCRVFVYRVESNLQCLWSFL